MTFAQALSDEYDSVKNVQMTPEQQQHFYIKAVRNGVQRVTAIHGNVFETPDAGQPAQQQPQQQQAQPSSVPPAARAQGNSNVAPTAPQQQSVADQVSRHGDGTVLDNSGLSLKGHQQSLEDELMKALDGG